MSIPLWKIRRELGRFGKQVRDLPEDVGTYLFATGRYDRTLASRIERLDGARPVGPRVAIYLIFPSAGMLASHFAALDYLDRKGYSVHVVSNLPLGPAEREQLLARCTRYLERPNFGYDFGGYRDAVLDLKPRLTELERLLLLNDSSWFPLPGSRDWLDDVEALDVDFAGAASNFATPRPDASAFREMRWSYSPDHRNFHYCSFALCLRPEVLRRPAFLEFWQGLRLTDKKKRTVRRGEIGFTQWALAQGLSHGATLDLTTLDREMDALDDARLWEVARDLIIPEDPKLLAVKEEVLKKGASRADLIALILTTVSRKGSSYALAAYATRELGYPFLKKSPSWLSRQASDLTLAIAEGLPGPEGEAIAAEVRALRAARRGWN